MKEVFEKNDFEKYQQTTKNKLNTLSSFGSSFSLTSTDKEGLVSVRDVSVEGVGVGAVGVVAGGVFDSVCFGSVDGWLGCF